jgi:hypothetical protein
LHASLAYGFIDGQLVVGAGPRITGVSFSRGTSSGLLSVGGVGYQVGAVFKPNGHQVRVGAAYKSPVEPSLAASGSDDSPVFAPTAIHLPWQAALGIAYQIGRRPMNPLFVAAEDRADELGKETDEERDDVEASLRREYFQRPRFYVLLTTELLLLGSARDSVGVSSFLRTSDRVERSGQHLTASPRAGVETELIPDWLKVRAGTYLEPARVPDATDRAHGTLGFDLKLFHWDVFGLIGDFDGWVVSGAADAARQYLNTSFTIGFWH